MGGTPRIDRGLPATGAPGEACYVAGLVIAPRESHMIEPRTTETAAAGGTKTRDRGRAKRRDA